MLKIMNPKELEGYCLKTPGGPPFELLAGKITAIMPVEGRNGYGYYVYISGNAYINGNLKAVFAKIRFSDRGGDRKMLATRLVASKAKIGDFVSVFCMQQNEERIALEFKFHGLWRFRGYLGEKNVILGKPVDFMEYKEYSSVKFIDAPNGYSRAFHRTVLFIGETRRPAYEQLADSPFAICNCGPAIKKNNNTYYKCYYLQTR